MLLQAYPVGSHAVTEHIKQRWGQKLTNRDDRLVKIVVGGFGDGGRIGNTSNFNRL